jgi:hypothetical protein
VLSGLAGLKLEKLLKRKNPYLFRAKAIDIASDLVRQLLDAHLSSQEETIFGDFLESLAIHICESVFGGKKSAIEGIDLEFERDKKRYIVSIKSGPNWGNSQQIKRMESNFAQAKKIAKANLEAINGCCYGQERQEFKGNYRKLCGQEFWSLISGEDEFYLSIVQPLGTDAKSRTDQYHAKYSQVVNEFTKQLLDKFCFQNGEIDWNRLLKFNSGKLS